MTCFRPTTDRKRWICSSNRRYNPSSRSNSVKSALIDEGGNDRHELWETAGAALAFGWDVVNAFLIDRGDGNDRYEAKIISMGCAEVRSNAFFLDEGFGSLDPEHLDLAMSGVERLVTAGPDRLVVVVSHVAALNERIEDLIVLDRDPTTGDTRVVSGSGCR